MRWIFWALAVVVLVAGGTLTLAAFVGGGEDPGLAVALIGLPAAWLFLFLAGLGLIVSRTRDTLQMTRWTVLALVGSFCTPIALLAVLAAAGGGVPHPGELLLLVVFLILGPGVFYLLWREMFFHRSGRGEL